MGQVFNSSRFAKAGGHSKRNKGSVSGAVAALERLEDRRLLSGTTPTPGPTPGVVLHELPMVNFTADLGDFVSIAPGDRLSASINWGDGITSTGLIKADGVVGLDEIKYEVDGNHTYQKAATYPITATVFERGPTGTTYVLLLETFNDTAIVARGNTVLNGSVSGTYVAAPIPAASPTSILIGGEYIFTGTGTAGVLGPVSAKGDLILPGPISAAAVGRATGTLTLTSIGTTPAASGSVTLALTGPIEKPGVIPTTLNYVITGGTGAFAGASGIGTISVVLGSGNTFKFDITSLLPPAGLPGTVLV
jgi:hypothetical protein